MFNWLSNFFGNRRGLRPAPHLQAVAVHNDHVWPNLSQAQAQTRLYQQSPWVYIAINRIAEAAALVPLHVLRLDGERRIEVQRHPLEVLLDAPNPYLSRFELFEQTFGMLETLDWSGFYLLNLERKDRGVKRNYRSPTYYTPCTSFRPDQKRRLRVGASAIPMISPSLTTKRFRPMRRINVWLMTRSSCCQNWSTDIRASSSKAS